MKKVRGKTLLSIPYHYHPLIIVLLASFVYWNILKADFVYDDRPAILTNDDVLGRTPWQSFLLSNDFWGNPIRLEGSHKSYRPLITASFRLQFAVHGLKAELFHGVNLLLHVVNSLLVLKLSRQLEIFETDQSLIASLLFACHPITSEAVCSIVGRADLLATFFILLAITNSSSNSTASSIVLAVLGVLSKETAIVLLPLLVIYELLFKVPNSKQFRRDFLNYSIAFGLMCYYRLQINNFQSPKFSRNDNPIAHEASFVSRTLTFMYLPIFHLMLMVFPASLSFDWSMDAIPRIKSIFDSRFLISVSTYALMISLLKNQLMTMVIQQGKITKKGHEIHILFLFSLLITPHLLSSNIFTYVGFVAAERILYLPSVAYCILLAYGFQEVQKKLNIEIKWIVVLLLAMYSFKTVNRVEDWKSEEALFKSAITVNPTKAHINLGYVYTMKKEYDLAKFHYHQALSRHSNLADAWYNLGIITSKSENGTLEAIRYYHQALLSRSNFAAAHLNLALLLHDSGRFDEASHHLDQCLTNSGDNLKSYRTHQKTRASCAFNKGRFLQKNEHFKEAIQDFEMALELGGPHFDHISSVINSIGSCYSQLGEEEMAERYFDKAIQENHVNSFLTMAHLRIRQNRTFEVEALFVKAMELAPQSITVLQNIALAEFHMRNYNRSMSFYRKALDVDSNHVESLRGMANLLQETQNFQESEKFYQKVALLQPNSYDAHANFGAILHLNQKYDAALREYETALALNPNDRITEENRKKLIRILKRKRNL